MTGDDSQRPSGALVWGLVCLLAWTIIGAALYFGAPS